MINAYSDFTSYLGNGSQAVYTFPYKITKAEQLLIMVFDTTNDTLVFSETGDVLTNVLSVTFDALHGGGQITLPANLANNRKLILKLSMESIEQEYQFREQNDFKIRRIEDALDSLVVSVQRLFEKSKRALRFSDKSSYGTLNTELDMVKATPDGIFKVNATGDGVELVDAATLVAGSGSGLPTGGAADNVLTHNGTNAVWSPFAFNGYSARFSQMFTSVSLVDTLNKILNLTYAPPAITLSGSSNVLREKGTPVSNITLTANVVRNSNDITSIQILDGATVLLDNTPPASPNSQSVNTVFAGPFSDNKTFTATASDGTTTSTSNTTYSFVYPYYRGAGAAALTGVQIAALTKEVINQNNNITRTIAASAGERFYFAYPQSYPALTSILDVNNFETIGDWTVRTVSITGLDATAQNYRVYEFNNPVVAGSYQYTFKV